MVVKAWQEIDDTLSAYAAEQQQARELEVRLQNAGDALRLARARFEGGMTDVTAVLDVRRNQLQARRDLAACAGRLAMHYAAVNKVLGNAPDPAGREDGGLLSAGAAPAASTR